MPQSVNRLIASAPAMADLSTILQGSLSRQSFGAARDAIGTVAEPVEAEGSCGGRPFASLAIRQ